MYTPDDTNLVLIKFLIGFCYSNQFRISNDFKMQNFKLLQHSMDWLCHRIFNIRMETFLKTAVNTI